MDAQQVAEILQRGLPAADIQINQEGNKFTVRIVSDAFSGKNTVTRHRMVYALVNHAIATNEIHALSLQTLTPDEAR